MGFYATESFPINTDPLTKNRVWGFRPSAGICTRRFPSQPLELHRDIVTTTAGTASGIVDWLSNDPIGISGGLNQYVFCENDPVNNRDPLGLSADDYEWEQMQWQDKLGKGYYYGTGNGESALDYYANVIIDPNSAWYAKGSAYAGAFFAALWTPDTYQETGWTLVSTATASQSLKGVDKWAHYPHRRGHRFPHLQFGKRRLPVPKKVIDWFRKSLVVVPTLDPNEPDVENDNEDSYQDK